MKRVLAGLIVLFVICGSAIAWIAAFGYGDDNIPFLLLTAMIPAAIVMLLASTVVVVSLTVIMIRLVEYALGYDDH